MTTKTTIVISGGLHGSQGICFCVPINGAQELVSGQSILFEVLTKDQMERADKHICNVKYCQCAKAHHKEVVIKLKTKKQQTKHKFSVTNKDTGAKTYHNTYHSANSYMNKHEITGTIEKL